MNCKKCPLYQEGNEKNCWCIGKMKLSIIVPTYNEEDTIFPLLDKLIHLPINKEIIVVDDGSTDNTFKRIRHLVESNQINYTSYNVNMGKGYAIRLGLDKAKGDIILIQDADLEYNPEDIPKLIEPILKKEAKVVYGVRCLCRKRLSFLLGNRLLTQAINKKFNVNLSDMMVGYKAITKEVIDSLNLESNDFRIEAELTMKILEKGIKIKEVPISYAPRTEGKKIKWTDGVKTFVMIKRA